MIITKVKYEKLFPTGAYLNEKIGFEAELIIAMNIDTKQRTNDLEDPLEAIEKLRQLAEQSHREKYPHLYNENRLQVTDPPSSVPDTQVENQAMSAMISDMLKCTSIDGSDGLESHRKWVYNTKDDGVIGVFEAKLKKLQGGK